MQQRYFIATHAAPLRIVRVHHKGCPLLDTCSNVRFIGTFNSLRYAKQYSLIHLGIGEGCVDCALNEQRSLIKQ
ncbi:hypothetical protein N5923_15775 [Erwiniaceae bacterium BAC15a-03b]|uniref:Uncharacterized protein n=1 Tax=Winslowiella arboricola TaxID=2978220 RepID=A0A9J6PTD8_9GAMM|nr:hypothetical protein [Winslowiella arboricola]MCU5774402.1 hypothetical protein [Winslowiella arboricola]MCU5778949.1 hypothetical protein [Winslowiella arboricola]